MTNTHPEAIVLDLTTHRDARRLKSQNEILHVKAFERLQELLGRYLNDAAQARPTEETPAIYLDRRHNTITVHGKRGSGKTTFLVSLAQWLQEKDQGLPLLGKSAAEAGHGIEVLGVIDPTLIEDKENIFVTVLALIKERVDAVYLRRQQSASWNDHETPADKQYQQWRDELLRLAEGLTLLDGIGHDNQHGEAWENPHFILEKGLRKAKSGQKLERQFHIFIEKSLQYLDQKAFLLALDDIDTDFSRGWPILEFLRKYLTSKKFLVILSGNLELYSTLVRLMKWENIPASLVVKDRQRWATYRDTIDELQSQYLLKLLKPENRIELHSLDHYLFNQNNDQIFLRFSTREAAGERQVPLKQLLGFLGRRGFYFAGVQDQRQFEEVLLRQPLRTVLQVLHSFGETLLPFMPDESGDEPSSDPNAFSRALERFHRSLPSIYMDALLAKGVPFESVASAARSQLFPMLVSYLTENSAWQEGYRLKPEFLDDHLNLASLAMGARLAREMNQDPALRLEFLIKIGRPREEILMLSTRKGQVSVPQYINFVGLNANDTALQIARRCLAVSRETPEGDLNRTGSSRGTIGIVGSRRPPKTALKAFLTDAPQVHPAIQGFRNRINTPLRSGTVLGTHYNTLESLKRHVIWWQHEIVSLPASIAFNAGQSATFFSIHNIIGIVSELMAVGRENLLVTGSNLDEEDKALDKVIVSILVRSSQLRSYPCPSWGAAEKPLSGTLQDQEDDEPDEDESGFEQAYSSLLLQASNFIEPLRRWVRWVASGQWTQPEGTPQPAQLPVHIVAKMWTRFFYTLSRIDSELPRKDQFAGALMHRYIVALFNAVLVEEVTHLHQGSASLSLSNPVRSDRVLRENLNRCRLANATHPFFDVVFSCPLWALFLDPDDLDASGPDDQSVYSRQLAAWERFVVVPRNLRPRRSARDLQLDGLMVKYRLDQDYTFPNLYHLYNSIPVYRGDK